MTNAHARTVTTKRNTPRVALALFLFLFGVYLLTASGHTYSPDEESILYVTQAFVTRGEFNIPNRNQAPVVGGQRGIGGKIYSGTGVLTSLLIVPFSVVGDALARALEPRARAFVLRVVVVTLFNPFVAALCGVVFFAWNLRLGVSTRAAVGATLIAALATMVWVYARTLYAETLLALWWLLAACAVRAFHDTHARRWMIVAGLACGLAILTKVQGALILPALVLYFVLLEKNSLRENGSWKTLRGWLEPALVFLLPFAFCVALLGYYNLIRFGAPLETGYGGVVADYSILRGVYGQLFSTGKSVLLYAPPLLLSLFALPRFAKRFGAEAGLCIALIATVILFHARVYYWAGDGAWGPRYLAATIPFWILPLGAALNDWWQTVWKRAIVLAVCAAGVFINVLGMSVNFDTYIQIEPREAVRHFEPGASPLLAQWRLFNDRVGAYWSAAQTHAGVFLTRGLVNQDELFPQFLPPRAAVWIKNADAQPAELALYALDYRVENRPKRTLAFFANGAPVHATRVPHADAGELEYRVPLPEASDITLEIVTVGSDPKGKSPQGDELGVHLQSLAVTRGEMLLPVSAALAVPNAPVADARELWGWFFRPNYAHFDHVVWYVNAAGVQAQTAALLLGVWGLLAGACTLGGGILLWRSLRAHGLNI